MSQEDEQRRQEAEAAAAQQQAAAAAQVNAGGIPFIPHRVMPPGSEGSEGVWADIDRAYAVEVQHMQAAARIQAAQASTAALTFQSQMLGLMLLGESEMPLMQQPVPQAPQWPSQQPPAAAQPPPVPTQPPSPVPASAANPTQPTPEGASTP